ncbi:MAG: peptidase [Kordiimonadales bacterium]|nr:MAG: peptidase [Kordiimonadales bacterium]
MTSVFMRVFLTALLALSVVGLAAVTPEASFAQEAAAQEAASQPFDPDATTEAYLASLSGPEKEKSDAYFEGGYWLILWGFLYGIVVAWLLLRNGFSARIRDWCEAHSKRPFLQTVFYSAAYIALSSVMSFPWAIYTSFYREHQYDLATQDFSAWFGDQAIGFIMAIIGASLFIAVLYAVIRKAGTKWWMWGAGITAGFIALLMLITPVFINPLFNTYTPLEAGPVKNAILAMAKDQGVEFDDVYMFDASAQSTRISANVSGLGATKRISLNDNLMNQSTVAEIKAVMGHELGHYVLGHVLVMVAMFSAILGLGYLFVTLAFGWATKRWGATWGIKGIDDIAGLPLASVLLSAYMFVMTPVFNTVIRVNESQADAFGLDAAKEPDGFATIALKLAKYRKLDPTPLEEFLLFDHPSGRTRVQMAMDWKAAHQDETKSEAE